MKPDRVSLTLSIIAGVWSLLSLSLSIYVLLTS